MHVWWPAPALCLRPKQNSLNAKNNGNHDASEWGRVRKYREVARIPADASNDVAERLQLSVEYWLQLLNFRIREDAPERSPALQHSRLFGLSQELSSPEYYDPHVVCV